MDINITIVVLIGITGWVLFGFYLQKSRRLEDSNLYLNKEFKYWRESFLEKQKEKNLGDERIERLLKSNNKYKQRLHRREMRIKNLLSKIEKAGL